MSVVFYRDDSLPFFELKSCSIDEISYKKHSHEEYSLGFIIKGQTKLWYEGTKADVDSKQFIIIPPNGIHVCHPYDGEWKYDMFYVAAEWLDNLTGEGIKLRCDRPVVRSIAPADRQNIFMLINKFTGSVSPLEKETAMMTGFINLFRGTEIIGRQLDHICETTKLKKVQEYLHGHFLEKITLDDLEKVTGLNKFYLVRLFQKEFNISPHAYQTMLKINFAKKELRLRRPLVDVAVKLGFFDQSHFTKAFKGYVGATPEEYKKSLGKINFLQYTANDFP